MLAEESLDGNLMYNTPPPGRTLQPDSRSILSDKSAPEALPEARTMDEDQLRPNGILDRFRDWLDQAQEEGLANNCLADGAEPPVEVGLVDLIREFTAVRHVVKLQTKSVRGLDEQLVAAIAAMQGAGRHFRAVEPKEAERPDRRPFRFSKPWPIWTNRLAAAHWRQKQPAGGSKVRRAISCDSSPARLPLSLHGNAGSAAVASGSGSIMQIPASVPDADRRFAAGRLCDGRANGSIEAWRTKVYLA